MSEIKVFKKAAHSPKPTQKPEESSYTADLLKQAATGIAGAPGNIIGGINNLIASAGQAFTGVPAQNIMATQPQLPTSSSLRKDFGVREPEGFAEELLDRIYGDLPIIGASALSGGAVLPLLGQSAAAGAGGQVAKDIGLGPIGELLGSIMGARYGTKGADKLKNLYTSFKTGKDIKSVKTGIVPYLEDLRKQSYKQAEDLYKGVKVPSRDLEQGLFQVYKDASRGAKSKAKDEVLKQIDDLSGRINFPSRDIAIQDVIDYKKDFNKFGYTRDLEESPFFKRLSGILDSFIQKEGSINQKALDAYEKAEKVHGILKTSEKAHDLIKSSPLGESLTKKGIIRSLFGIGKQTRQDIKDTVNFFSQIPEARNYYANTLKGLAENNKTLAANSLKRLVSAFNKYEPEKQQKTSEIKVFKKKS